MAGYLAKIQGENFHFYFDDDHQVMNFTRTIYVEEEDESRAELSALDMIQEQLRRNALWIEEGEQLVTVDELKPCGDNTRLNVDHDFFWYFANE